MINGILNIYKEKGYTSHDVVARLRGIVGQRKIGHTGTLDPDAEGVLPVCLGRATKVCDMLTDRDKTYETVLLLGRTTDTQDATGQTLSESPAGDLDPDQVRECILGFIGGYEQIPPMYSALKVGGRKLYELAREGKTVERKSRHVVIRDIRIMEICLPRIRMEVSCTKGTYIRTLCHDIGQRLGAGGCMERLLRTKSGRFHVEESVTLDEVEQAQETGELDRLLLPLDSVFAELNKVTVKDRYASLGYNGNPLRTDQVDTENDCPEAAGEYRLYDKRGHFIGIYRYDERKCRFCPEKMFLDPDQIRERT